MSDYGELTTAGILEVFAEEISTRHGGRVSDAFDDGLRLFARSVLPRIEALRPGDKVQGGVALRANEQEVWLHPYLFRLVCRNGAIIAQTLATRHLDELHLRTAEDAKEFLREAVAACCDEDEFKGSVFRMRTASETNADLALNFMPFISHLSAHFSPQSNAGWVSEIMERFFRDGDQSRFGLINAVTATARDTRDPELRWNLEELGGGIAIGKIPDSPRAPTTSAARGRRHVMSIG